MRWLARPIARRVARWEAAARVLAARWPPCRLGLAPSRCVEGGRPGRCRGARWRCRFPTARRLRANGRQGQASAPRGAVAPGPRSPRPHRRASGSPRRRVLPRTPATSAGFRSVGVVEDIQGVLTRASLGVVSRGACVGALGSGWRGLVARLRWDRVAAGVTGRRVRARPARDRRWVR